MGGTWSRNELSFTVTFMGSGVSGTQNILEIEDFSCGDGCTPKRDGLYLKTWNFNSGDFDQERTSTTETFLSTVMEETAADYNNYECGRRGKCDYDTGKCECFEGYAGLSCSTQQALVQLHYSGATVVRPECIRSRRNRSLQLRCCPLNPSEYI